MCRLLTRSSRIIRKICAVLNDHRSAIGKEGYKAVSAVWASDEELGSPDGKIAYVEDLLEDMRFVYKDPDANVRSPFHAHD